MIVVATNPYLGRADVSGPSKGIAALLAWMTTAGQVYTVRSGARSIEAQAMLYSWGRTVTNPDMERTGDPGPDGLGVYATRTMGSSHLRDAHGQFRAIDVECSPSARAELEAAAAQLGLQTLAWDPGHYEDPPSAGDVVAGVAAAGSGVLVGALVLLFLFLK